MQRKRLSISGLLILLFFFFSFTFTGCGEDKDFKPEDPKNGQKEKPKDPENPKEPEDPEEPEIPEFSALVTVNPSPEAVNVYNFLKENFGKNIISGTMANVSWNTNEAQWVNKHTGAYPALNCFDYIHLHASPASWINYSNISVVEDWWEANGLVSIMWHWNVPVNEGSRTYAFYTSGTTFDIIKAVQAGTYENGIVIADLEKTANYLLLLKQKNIPILWRPLHEAAGRWFWWGAKGAEPLKALWQLMFETFEAKGLNNLIWVWTSEINDAAWYPGDQYVDIIGRDLYNDRNGTKAKSNYTSLKNNYPGKLIALSECGDVALVSNQWKAGATWSWFMPWYDYSRTVSVTGTDFDQTAHEHANINFWTNAFADPLVITRDKMPNLK